MSDEAPREFVGNGRYAVDRLLGAGGAGAVNLAYDTMLSRWVAIKRMPAGDKAALREASIIARLQHPNIVMIHDIFEQGEEVFFVMELVLGPTLEELAEGMNEETFRDFATQCLQGLGAAHEQNVVHRDVKPGNIMLAPLAQGGYRVKLLDFGQSRAMEEPSLQTIDHNGAVVGSIYMMSPEQLSHEPLDLRTDIYSLGCVFYQALTMQRPFTGRSVPEVCAAHFQHRHTPLRTLRPDLPMLLTMWVEKLFSFDRRDRPASAVEALSLLKETVGGTVIRVVTPLDITAPVSPVLKRTQSLVLPAVPMALRPKPLSGAATAPMVKTQAIAKAKPEVLAAQEAQDVLAAQEGTACQSRHDPPEHADAALTSSAVLDQAESPETPAAIYTPPPGEYVAPEIPQTLPRRIWRRLTEKRFLFISVVAHLLLGIIAAIFVVQSITAKRKLTFTSSPPSPNPSQRALEHKVTMAKKQNTMSAPAQAKRITSTGLAKVSLPDMPAISSSTDFNAGKMAGMGGTGVGLGFKGGLTSSGGKAALGGPISFFGLRGKNENVLKAKFYDLKQTNTKKPSKPMTGADFVELVRKFVNDNGWRESYLSKYYCAPAPLFSARIYMPTDQSDAAPKAFGVEKNVAPGLWLLHYKGKFRALKKGTFRFVGCGDNLLVVRLNNKNVLDGSGDKSPAIDPSFNSNPQELLGMACADGWQLKAGQWFTTNQGQTFNIEIIAGDAEGGLFSAFLFVEEKGASYPMRPDGSGRIYPLLELDNQPMPPIPNPDPRYNPPFPEKSERLFEGMKATL